jgi:heat shock protein HtpX
MAIMSRLKLGALLVFPAACVVAMGYWLGSEWAFLAAVLLAVLIVSIYLLADRVVLKSCGAELLTEYHSLPLLRMVEDLSKRAGVAMPRMYMMPGEAPNICAVGRNEQTSAIVVTEGLLKELKPEEVSCAIVHELVHLYFKDTSVTSLAAVLAGMLGMATKSARAAANGSTEARGLHTVTAPVAALIVRFLVSPSNELRADRLAAKLLGNPLAMANTIRTMEKKKNILPLEAVPSVAHMFLVSPLRHSRIAALFQVHPSLEERVKHLEQLAESLSRQPLALPSR